MFTQKCFIRKNTPELVKRLEELGYRASFSASNGYGEYLYAFNGTIVGGEYNAYNEKTGFIDCVTNTELVLAIASLRDGTDKNQVFIHQDGNFYKCECDSKIDMWGDFEEPELYPRKATVSELIELFKK